LARQIKRHQGKIAPSIILRGGTLLQCRGQARRSAQNVRRLGSSWAHTASIHRLRVLSGRRSSSTGAHHDPGIVGKRRSGVEEADCRHARIRDRYRRSPSPRSGAPTRPKQSCGTKRRQRDLPCPRTESSELR
jgi:hypothetical protein